MNSSDADILRRWEDCWREWQSMIDLIGTISGVPWAPEILASFLDATGKDLSVLVREIKDRGLLPGFDFIGRIREFARKGMARLREQPGVEAQGPLPLGIYTTDAIVCWEWAEFRERDRGSVHFVERLEAIETEEEGISLSRSRVVEIMMSVSPESFGDRP